MKIFGKNFDDKKSKKFIYTAVALVLVGWFVFRFTMVIVENRMKVFNPIRESNKNGTLVETIVATKKNGVVKIPLVVKNNRAYVSPSRLGKFKSGQKIGTGKIVSVGANLDYDTGMHIVKTSGVADGLNYAESNFQCFFIPVYAVRNGVVMVAQENVSQSRKVKVLAQDADTACISSGLDDGDIVILSNIEENKKISIKD